MKRKVLVIVLALMLCLSLCACGSYRTSYDANDNGMNGQNTDRMPDAKDGYVVDDNGTNGILDGDLTSPSPNVTNKR